jgi:FixJ family two-component response regulator
MTKRTRASYVPVISIVDDDEAIRNFTSSFIRSLRHKEHTFVSAEDFLQSRHLAETSCLICDVQMPNMDGIELQRVLNGQGGRIHIIFITGFPDAAVEARAMNAGAICFLSKPYDGDEMAGYIVGR